MTKIQKLKIIFLACVLSLVAVPVFAAELFFDAKTNEFGIDQEFRMDVLLDTEGEYMNAVEGFIIFPADLVLFKETRTGNSIINFWVEQPGLKTREKIVFSGIVPGGYNGNSGHLFSIVFKAKKEGVARFDINDARVLRNDGQGTEIPLTISNFQFNIKEVGLPKEVRLPEIKDAERPESFVPEIAKDTTLFDGKWFVVFATQDKASGVDHFEIKESRQIIFSMFKKWTFAESPHVLRDQELRSFLFVKAVDKVGNERIIKIAPRNPLAWYENYENWIMIIVGVFLFIIWYLWRRKLKH